MSKISALSAISLFLALGVRTGRAQALRTPPYAEWRVDGISGRATTVQAAGGYTIPLGVYVRLAAIAGVGPQWRDGKTMMAGRTDVIGRFVLDPFRQTPVAVSIGGGVSVPYERNAVTRPYLTAVIDVEGRKHRRFTPAVQLGLGGGARLGLVFRTSVPQRR